MKKRKPNPKRPRLYIHKWGDFPIIVHPQKTHTVAFEWYSNLWETWLTDRTHWIDEKLKHYDFVDNL